MKTILLIACALFAASAARAGEPATAQADSMTAELSVGATVQVKLECNPTTGYEWRLKSVNPKVARLVGEIEFQRGASEPGLVGAGGACVATFKGVKPGKTKAVLEYRRSWEKGKAEQTFTARLTVVKKKGS